MSVKGPVALSPKAAPIHRIPSLFLAVKYTINLVDGREH